MSQNLNSNRGRDERKSTTQKVRVISTGAYPRILEEEFARRRTFSGCKTDTRLKQIPILQAHNQEKVDFSHNLIKRMENLDCMRRLRQLNLSYNRIIIVEGIFLLRKLQELNLSHNYIEELPKDFRTMTGLKSLQLHNNKLTQLETLDSISCLRLVKLTLENNYVCKKPGFRKYVQIHFKWLENLDRKPYSHRSLEGSNPYETPLESMAEEPNEQLRTCERQVQKVQPRDHNNTTQRRQILKEDTPAVTVSKPEATEIKLVKTERIGKDSEIISYREYLKRQSNNSSMGDSNFLNQQRKLVEGKAKISQMLSEQRRSLNELIQSYVALMRDFKEVRDADDELFRRWRDKMTTDSKLISKFIALVDNIESLFESEQENMSNLKECIIAAGEDSPTSLTLHLGKTIKLRRESHDQVANRLTKAINLGSMEILNIQNEQFINGASSTKEIVDCKAKFHNYMSLYKRAHKLQQTVLAQWKDYSSTANHLVDISAMMGNSSQQESPSKLSPPHEPKDSSSGLKKLLFSDRVQHSDSALANDEETLRQLQQRLNSETEKCRNLQEQLALVSKAQQSMREEFEEEREERIECQQLLQQQISTLTSEKTVYRQKWESVELFHSENSKLYQRLTEHQQHIISLMKQKLTGDFFQQLILNQAQTIEQLLQANEELQGKYTLEVKKELMNNRLEHTSKITSKEHGCSKTRNTRYPDTNCVVGLQSSDSNLLEYSEERMNSKPKEPNVNLVSEFNIHGSDSAIRESARFKQSVSFHNLSRDRPSATKPTGPDYFRKSSSGFSFKKSKKSLLSGIKGNQHQHIATEQNESEVMMHYHHHTESENNKENEHPNYNSRHRVTEVVDTRSKAFEKKEPDQTQNYKNYMKYYLRNNIIEVLSQGDVHPHLKSRWTKEEIAHKKYHSFAGPRLLATSDKSNSRSMERVLRC